MNDTREALLDVVSAHAVECGIRQRSGHPTLDMPETLAVVQGLYTAIDGLEMAIGVLHDLQDERDEGDADDGDKPS